MTKKELLESIKDVSENAYIKFGLKEEDAKEVQVITSNFVGLKFKTETIVIK